MRSLATFFLSLLTLAAQAAAAQDLPTRVGRVAFIEGPVSIYQDPDQGWDKAYVNSPITSENSLWTDPGARAEVRVGGLALRLDEATQLDISHLDDDGIDAQVERGTLAIRVRHFDRNDRYRFSTPHASFRLLADGRYRIDVDPERDEARLTVVSGSAQLESSRGGVRVDTGRTIVVSGGPSPSYAFERVRIDAFDRWADARDQQWSERAVTRYVSPDVTGYEDLDRYGSWVEEPDYGAIWYPTRVASGWAPYRHGHWSYVRPWGWTWIDDQPWGYAPSHYGRWVYVGNRWGWHPGERARRQAWAPALVGWIGGSNWSVGVSSGAQAPAVGWYPLSPWERYEPWYRASPAYVNLINIVVRDRERAPRNWQGRGDDWRRWNRDRGATVVERDAFIQRRDVRQAMVQVTPEMVRQQPQAQGTNVLPSRNELQRFRTEQRQAAPAPQQQPAAAPQGGVQRGDRADRGDRGDRGDRSRRDERPNFARPPSMQPPVPAAQAPQAQPGAPRSTADVMNPGARNLQQPQQAVPAPAPQANPLGRADGRQQREAQQQQERAAKEAQQNQERAARDARQNQERAAREAQQNQERAAREGRERTAKEAQQNQLQQQNQQREQQQRAAREAQQQQERAAREAQQQQQQLQRQQRDAQQQQERAAREAQQQQQVQRQQLQQQQERAAREAQQAQKDAAQQQERAAREAQNQLQRQQREAQPKPQQQPQPKAEPAQNRAPRGGDKDDKEKADKEKADKEKADKEKPDKPDREERGGGRQR